MRRISTWLSVAAVVVGMFAGSAATAGEILSVSVTPNPIVDPAKQFAINVTGKGTCDHLVVYMQVAEGGVTAKSKVWEKKNFSFSMPPQVQGTVSSSGQGISPGKKIVSAEPGPGAQTCGTATATVLLTVQGQLPVVPLQRIPSASSGKKPVDPLTLRGFNPQPEPPAMPVPPAGGVPVQK